MRRIVESVTANLQSNEQKMEAIYSWISNSIVWSEKNRFLCSQDINDVIDSKQGSSADFCFLLISMLRYAGIQCEPVILSTRRRRCNTGFISDYIPV